MHASIPGLSLLYDLTVMDIFHSQHGDQAASGARSLTLTAALTSFASASMDSRAFNLWRGRDLSRVLAAIPSSSSSSSESHSCGCGSTCWHPCRPQRPYPLQLVGKSRHRCRGVSGCALLPAQAQKSAHKESLPWEGGGRCRLFLRKVSPRHQSALNRHHFPVPPPTNHSPG